MRVGVRRLLNVASVLGVVLAFAALAFAHDPQRSAPGLRDPLTAAASRPSPEQIEAIEKARLALREKALPLERELDRKRLELEGLMSGPGAEPDRVLGLRRQVSQLERDLEDLWFEAEAQMSQTLLPEQRVRFGYAGDLLAGHDMWSCDGGCPWHERSSWSRGSGHRWRGGWSGGGRRGHCW